MSSIECNCPRDSYADTVFTLLHKRWSLQYMLYIELQRGSQSVTIQNCPWLCDYTAKLPVTLSCDHGKKINCVTVYRIWRNTVGHTYICHIWGHNPTSTVLPLLHGAYWGDTPCFQNCIALETQTMQNVMHVTVTFTIDGENCPLFRWSFSHCNPPLLSAATNTVSVPYLPTHFFCSSLSIA